MVDHWEKFGPPVYIAAAAYLGLVGKDNKPNRDPSNPSSSGNLNDLAQLLSGSGGVLNG